MNIECTIDVDMNDLTVLVDYKNARQVAVDLARDRRNVVCHSGAALVWWRCTNHHNVTHVAKRNVKLNIAENEIG